MANAGAEAEALFEQYLESTGRTWAYEAEAGASRPDYWVPIGASQVVCEVRRMGARPPERAGSLDVYGPIRTAIKRKARQGAALKGKLPYVVVLWAPYWPTDEIAIAGAMFGNYGIVMPFDPATGTADIDRAEHDFGRDGQLRPGQGTRFSGVAVIHTFNPGSKGLREEVAARVADEQTFRPDGRIDLRRKLSIGLEVGQRRIDEGLFVEGATSVRVEAFHNPRAVVAMPTDLFIGPYDRQWNVDARSRDVSTFIGPRFDELD